MKKISYICNRCKKEIKTEGTRIIPHLFNSATGEISGEVEVPDNDVHFCLDCTKEIVKEILRPPEDKGTPIRAAPVKHTRLKKEQRLDAGKVMALHRAGWSDEKIADEMGSTERQVYQCIRYQKKKINSGNKSDGKEQAHEHSI